MGYKNRYLKEEAEEEQKYDPIHVKTIESSIENFYDCCSYSGIPLVCWSMNLVLSEYILGTIIVGSMRWIMQTSMHLEEEWEITLSTFFQFRF